MGSCRGLLRTEIASIDATCFRRAHGPLVFYLPHIWYISWMAKFALKSEYKPSGDQPQAIAELMEGLRAGKRDQTLLGVTGSGKTYTVANIIEKFDKPT